MRTLVTGWFRRLWGNFFAHNNRPLRVLFANGNEQMTPAVQVLLECATNGRTVTTIERDDWNDIATDAREHGLDLLLVNFTQATDRERQGQSAADFTTAHLSELKRRYRKPVVIFTSWEFPGLFARLEAAGADAIIPMPFVAHDVVAVLRRLLG